MRTLKSVLGFEIVKSVLGFPIVVVGVLLLADSALAWDPTGWEPPGLSRWVDIGPNLKTRYYIGSETQQAKANARYIRGHWGIENTLHWTLDMVFDEDRNRTRKDHGPENIALLRRQAISILRAFGNNEILGDRGVQLRRRSLSRRDIRN